MAFYLQTVGGLVLTCFAANLVRLDNPTTTTSINASSSAHLWVAQNGPLSNTYYICNTKYGTCLGTLRKVEQWALIGAENKILANEYQLLWNINIIANTFTLTPVENSGLALDVVLGLIDKPQAVLQLYALHGQASQQFRVVEASELNAETA